MNISEVLKKHWRNKASFSSFGGVCNWLFRKFVKKYGKGRERNTEIKVFDNIQIAEIAIANTKLYANWSEGFIGTSLKKTNLYLIVQM